MSSPRSTTRLEVGAEGEGVPPCTHNRRSARGLLQYEDLLKFFSFHVRFTWTYVPKGVLWSHGKHRHEPTPNPTDLRVRSRPPDRRDRRLAADRLRLLHRRPRRTPPMKRPAYLDQDPYDRKAPPCGCTPRTICDACRAALKALRFLVIGGARARRRPGRPEQDTEG